ncbi:hypothetical protein O6H91_Y009600 [Diphasiastrum complanatum]|nr:hypothetical protein O6H91_Y009600 [Diphasiastrum complanatum]
MKREIVRMQLDLETALKDLNSNKQQIKQLAQNEQDARHKGSCLDYPQQFNKDELEIAERQSPKKLGGEILKIDSIHASDYSGNDSYPQILSTRITSNRASTEERLHHISPQRLERIVATVRGWLQDSPTPNESFVLQRKFASSSTPNLLNSIKEEANLCIARRRAFSFQQSRLQELSSDIWIRNSDPRRVSDLMRNTQKEDFHAKTNLEHPTQHFQAFTNSNMDDETQQVNRECSPCENTSFVKDLLPNAANSTVPVLDKAPVFRIIKRKNIKIADFLVRSAYLSMFSELWITFTHRYLFHKFLQSTFHTERKRFLTYRMKENLNFII